MYNFVFCIPSYNRRFLLKNCILAIKRHCPDYKAISVCYQNDEPFPFSGEDRLIYNTYPALRYAGLARNVAYSQVRHLVDENTILVFMDDDCILETPVLSSDFEDILNNNERVGIMRLNANNAVRKVYKSDVNWTGGGIAIKPIVFERIGMFGMMICKNDLEIFVKCKSLGFNNYLMKTPNASHRVKQKGGLNDVLRRPSLGDNSFNPNGMLDIPNVYKDIVCRNESKYGFKIKKK